MLLNEQFNLKVVIVKLTNSPPYKSMLLWLQSKFHKFVGNLGSDVSWLFEQFRILNCRGKVGKLEIESELQYILTKELGSTGSVWREGLLSQLRFWSELGRIGKYVRPSYEQDNNSSPAGKAGRELRSGLYEQYNEFSDCGKAGSDVRLFIPQPRSVKDPGRIGIVDIEFAWHCNCIRPFGKVGKVVRLL